MVASPGADQTVNRAELAAVAEGMGFEPVVTEVLESNAVVPTLLAAAGTEGLICLPTRAHGSVAVMVLGGVATDLLLQATVPVVLVGPDVGPDADLGLVEVCVDDAPVGAARVDEIGGWAQHLGVRLRVVHAEPAQAAPTERRPTEDLVALALRAMDRFGIDAEAAVVTGDSVSTAIVEDATRHRAGIIAVAVPPRSRLRRRALGSEALAVARTAGAAVLAVPVTVDS